MKFETTRFEPALEHAAPELFRLTSMGLFRSHGEFRWEMVARRFALHVVHDGIGWFVEDDVSSRVGPGEAYLHWPGRHYRYYDEPGRPWRYDFVTFEGEIDPRLLPGQPKMVETRRIIPAMQEVRQFYGSGQMTTAHATRLAWALVAAMTPDGASVKPADLGDQLAAMVNRRDTPLPTVGQIARDMGIDRSTLYRRFRAETGESIKAWLDRHRLARAEDLLRQSRTSVGDIAAICGFRDPMYFSRAFRRAHGIPPGQWRKVAQAT